MSAHLQLLLLLLLTVTSECLTVGTKFVGVYPENIAYYHPTVATNIVRLTGLYDGTAVEVTLDAAASHTVDSGAVADVDVSNDRELDKSNSTEKIMLLSGADLEKPFAAEIVSRRDNSFQSAVLVPTDQLGKTYMIPPLPESVAGPQLYGNYRTIEVTERSPYKLIIVGTESAPTTVTLPGGGAVELAKDEVQQFWVYQDMVSRTVTGTAPFLAIFAHPCVMLYDCTCGAQYTPLRSFNDTAQTFIIPPVFNEEAPEKTFLLKTSATAQEDFISGSVTANGPVLLYKPGLLLNLIPEEDFSSCFMIQKVPDAAENWAVIVAPADITAHVMMGNNAVNHSWQSVPNSKYKYAKFELTDDKTVFWNKFGLMAAYFMGKKDSSKDVWFGHPAASISKIPDHRGCVLEPHIIEVEHKARSWQESIQACRAKGLDLISLSDEILQENIYNWTLNLNQNLTELWMGLRRSSYTGQWYWISKDLLNHEDWCQGFQVSSRDTRQCGRFNLIDHGKPGWVPHHCCNTAKAVCYKPPVLLTI